MKYVKILGLLAVAAAAMMAFAASASATTVTDSTGNGTPTIHAENEKGHVSLHNSIVNIECSSTVQGTVTAHGASTTASGALTSLGFTNCTNEWVIDVAEPTGSLEIHYTGAGSGHGEGTLTSTGSKVTATRAGLSCVYETKNTPIGTVVGGTPATLTISASIPRVGGSFLCGGSTATWTGSYVTTGTLKIEP